MEFEQFRDPRNKRRIIVPEGINPKNFLEWMLTHPQEKEIIITAVANSDDEELHPVKSDNTGT